MRSATRTYGVLIDAGFLKRQLGTRERPATYDQIDAFLTDLGKTAPLDEFALYRIFYYDAKPSREKKQKPLDGGEVDFAQSDVAKRGEQIHLDICKRPFVAVRLGELHFRGWRLRKGTLPMRAPDVLVTANDLEPNIVQKGVDMRIGLDIAALALKRIVDVVVLVTGDTDFIPAMKFARREGLQLFLVSLGRPVHQSLLEHTDLVIQVTPSRTASTEPAALRPQTVRNPA